MMSERSDWTDWNDHLFVYVMRGGDIRKIGVTTNPSRRLKQIENKTGLSLGLEFLASHPVRFLRDIEQSVHDILHHKRVHGEWFAVTLDEAEKAIIRCLMAKVHRRGWRDIEADYRNVRDDVIAKAETDLERLDERDINQVILRGPPSGMTATERLCAVLDWKYGKLSSGETAKKHGVSKNTMFRCFGDRREADQWL